MNDQPTRPALPPVAWLASSIWMGCVLGERVCFSGGWRSLAALIAIALICSALACASRRSGFVTLACIGLLCGTALSAVEWWSLAERLEIVEDCGAREWAGVVEADPASGAFGAIVRVRLLGGPLHGARVRVGWPDGQPVPELGRQVCFSAVLKPLPLEEEWARRVARGGACASGNAWSARIGRWRSGWSGPLYAWRAARLARMHGVPGPGGDLAEGIVLGDRRRLVGTATEQDFQVLGLSHLVAVSGSHLALACGAVAFLGTLLGLPKRWLVCLTVVAGAAYALVTGMPYSALRSLLMLAVAGAGQLVGRRGDGIASLSVAVIGVLALEPWSAFDLGLQLSVLAVASLLLFGSVVTAWVATGARGFARLIASPLALTLVAQAATIPLVASTFGMVSVLAPVANALVGALVSVALLLGLGGAAVGSMVPIVGDQGLRAAASVLAVTARIAEAMANLPGAAVAVGGGPALVVATVAAGVVTWVRWPLPRCPGSSRRFTLAALACSVALALGPAPPRQASVTVLDVGQGDAILVRDSGRAMLVDTGPDVLALRRALARSGVRRVDALVLTHAHDDHTGGNAGLATVATVGWMGVPAREPAEGKGSFDGFNLPDNGAPTRTVAAGDSWRVGDIEVSVLWPPRPCDIELDTNDTSVVLRLRRGDFEMVLTGDAEEAAQDGMGAAGLLASVEALKVPHHGSTNGLTPEALREWAPRTALISVGAGNDFGHPNTETLQLLADAGVQVLRTDENGDLTVAIGHRGYRVEAARRGRSESVRARMERGRPVPWAARAQSVLLTSKGIRGGQDRIAKARVPDLRRRGSAAGPRPPPAA